MQMLKKMEITPFPIIPFPFTTNKKSKREMVVSGGEIYILDQ